MTHSSRTREHQRPASRPPASELVTTPLAQPVSGDRPAPFREAELTRHPPTLQQVLDLQRTAGNRATGRLLRQAIGVQRWGASEHEMIGNKGSANRTVELADGYSLTFGEMVALAADHFENIEQMRTFASHTRGGPGSRAEIEYALHWKLNKPGRKWDAAAKDAQEARYYTLAGNNQSHFLNPAAGDLDKDPAKRAGDAKAYVNEKYTKAPRGASQAYRMNHVWAIKETVEAAHRRDSYDKAMAVEAFGAHYLTDAFSAGHVRTPRAAAKEYWDAKVPMFVANLAGFIAEGVAKNLGVWQKKVVPTDATMRQDLPWVGTTAKVEKMLRTKRFTFGDVVGGALHDWDNATGISATIRGTDVELLGDDRLTRDSNGGMPYAIKAVSEGVSDIERAFALGHKGRDVDGVLDDLLDRDLFAPELWFPKPKADVDQKPDSKSIKWNYPDVFSLLADPRFQEAVKLFLKEKEGVLREVADELEPDQRDAFVKGVLSKLRAKPLEALMSVVQWVPSLTMSKPWEAETAADYYHKAEKLKGGIASLTLNQRLRLMSKLMHHTYGGKRELLGILTSATDSEARSLINVFGWDRLHGQIDERAMPFKDRFPKKTYGK